MSQVVRRPRYAYDDYVQLDEDSHVKHEYLDGQIYAMAGGSPEHAELAGNVIAALRTRLRGRGCHVYSSDLRVRVLATGLATYPDATVVCGEVAIDPADRRRQTATNPILVVEVLSPTTEDYDRGEKLEHYKRIESLREVLLVAHDRARVEVWQRAPDGTWAKAECSMAATVRLAGVSCEIPVEEIYGDVRVAT
jgi:Uma2 family endonuclease